MSRDISLRLGCTVAVIKHSLPTHLPCLYIFSDAYLFPCTPRFCDYRRICGTHQSLTPLERVAVDFYGPRKGSGFQLNQSADAVELNVSLKLPRSPSSN